MPTLDDFKKFYTDTQIQGILKAPQFGPSQKKNYNWAHKMYSNDQFSKIFYILCKFYIIFR